MNILIVFIVALRGRGRGRGRGLVAAADVHRRCSHVFAAPPVALEHPAPHPAPPPDPATVTRVSNHKICMCAHVRVWYFLIKLPRPRVRAINVQ